MTGQVAVVTGAGGGLGTAIALGLHEAGYRVAVADINLAAAEMVAARLDCSGETAVALGLDVREKASFTSALDLLCARWGSVAVLVNNAAVTEIKPIMEITADEFDAVLAVNLRGTFVGCQVFGSYFRTQGYGRIINLASLAAQNGGTATGAHYAASKGGILTLTKAFARELAASGVTVNAIAPGPLDLPIVYQAVPADRMADYLKMIPVGGLGDPAFIASMVVQFASPGAGFTTGATWDANGGLYLR